MQETEYSRKLDKTGRLMIPIRLREEMHMVVGREYYFSTHEHEGRKYICVDCGPVDAPQITLEDAIQLVQKNGLKIVQDAN